MVSEGNLFTSMRHDYVAILNVPMKNSSKGQTWVRLNFLIRFNSVSKSLDSTQFMTPNGFKRIDSNQVTAQNGFLKFDSNRPMTHTASRIF